VTRFRFALCLVPLALLVACGGPSVPPAANYGSISGRDGTYRIGTIPSGQYTMAISSPQGYAAPNFNAPPFSGSIDSGQTITVDIPLNKT
jgi:hypothetical protein